MRAPPRPPSAQSRGAASERPRRISLVRSRSALAAAPVTSCGGGRSTPRIRSPSRPRRMALAMRALERAGLREHLAQLRLLESDLGAPEGAFDQPLAQRVVAGQRRTLGRIPYERKPELGASVLHGSGGRSSSPAEK